MKQSKRNYSKEDLEGLAKIFKMVAHPVKLEILEVLESHEPMDVSSLCAEIGAECQISMMSQHLAKMKDNGILQSEKKGKQVFYRIANRRLLRALDELEGTLKIKTS
ncbi:metalloregulator ArsR/SmtB family transcription factor [Flavobacteriales bacterium]|nr:metalloregulator ArsR/SmtB family transcription factor [Flavobacteriales bacterium]